MFMANTSNIVKKDRDKVSGESQLTDWRYRLELVDVSRIKENPNNFYSDTEDELLDLTIELERVLKPVILKDDYTLLDGHRRVRRAKKLGLTQVPAIVISNDLDDKELITLLNLYRKKSPRELYHEALVLRDYIKRKCAQGHTKGRVLEKVSEKLGTSWRQLHRIIYIYTNEKAVPSIVKQLDEGKLSIKAAYLKMKKILERRGKSFTDKARKSTYFSLAQRYPQYLYVLREILRETKPLLKSKEEVEEFYKKIRLAEQQLKKDVNPLDVFIKEFYLEEEVKVKVPRKYLEALYLLAISNMEYSSEGQIDSEIALVEVLKEKLREIDYSKIIKRVKLKLLNEWNYDSKLDELIKEIEGEDSVD
jgi:ParB-like chromosome segregation protein Spo0J